MAKRGRTTVGALMMLKLGPRDMHVPGIPTPPERRYGRNPPREEDPELSIPVPIRDLTPVQRIPTVTKRSLGNLGANQGAAIGWQGGVRA